MSTTPAPNVAAHTPSTKQRLAYLYRCVRGYLDPERFRCPSCGSKSSDVVKRKMLVSALVRCRDCRLLFRVPTDNVEHNYEFYQSDYSVGFTTDCPDDKELATLLKSRFAGTERSYANRIEVLRSLGVGPGSRILEYGASWGYGAWQLKEAGFDVVGFEISKPRARFAREKLGVTVEDDLTRLVPPFDVFFSSHVLEHVPSIAETIALASKWIRPGGLFVAYTPNGSFQRLENQGTYHKEWGDVHPNVLDDEFYRTAFPDRPMLLCSNPYPQDALKSWDRKANLILPLKGKELLAVVAF